MVNEIVLILIGLSRTTQTTVAKAKRTVGDDGSSCCLNCTKMLAQDKFKDDYVQTCVDCCDRAVQNYKRRKLAHAAAPERIDSKRVTAMKDDRATDERSATYPPHVHFARDTQVFDAKILFPEGALLDDVLAWSQTYDRLNQREYARVAFVQKFQLEKFKRSHKGKGSSWIDEDTGEKLCLTVENAVRFLRRAANEFKLTSPREAQPIDADFQSADGQSGTFLEFTNRLTKIFVQGLSDSTPELASRIVRKYWKACLCWSASAQATAPARMRAWEDFSGVALLKFLGGTCRVAGLIPDLLADLCVSKFEETDYLESEYKVYSSARFVCVIPPRDVGNRRMRGAVWSAHKFGYRWLKDAEDSSEVHVAPFEGQLHTVQNSFESMGGGSHLVPPERYFGECYDSRIVEHIRLEGFEEESRSRTNSSYTGLMIQNDSGQRRVSGKYTLLVHIDATTNIIWSTDTHLYFGGFSLAGVRFADMMAIGDDTSIQQVKRDDELVYVSNSLLSGSATIQACAVNLRRYVYRADPLKHQVVIDGAAADATAVADTNTLTGSEWDATDFHRKSSGIEHALNAICINRVLEEKFPDALTGLALSPSKVERLADVADAEARLAAKVIYLKTQIAVGAFDVSLYSSEGLAKHVASRPRNVFGQSIRIDRADLFKTPKPPFPTCNGVFFLQQWTHHIIPLRKLREEVDRRRQQEHDS